MTQIAATTGSIGAKGHHAGKAHGAAAAGADFAALAAGLGLPTEEGETAGADALSLTGKDAGTGEEARGEGEAGTPVVIDLSLTAAAQSAVADVVAAQPQAVTPPPTDFTGKSATKDDAIALDGRAPDRAGWRMLAAAAPATAETEAASETPVATTDLPATEIASLLPSDAKPTAHEAKLARQAAQGKGEAGVQPDGKVATTTTETAPATAEAAQTVTQGEAKPLPPRAIRTGVQTGAALRQAVSESIKPSTAPDTPVTARTDAQAAPIFTALPQAQAAAAKTMAKPMQPIVRETTDPAIEVVTDTAVAATQTAITGTPVMSALHRAAPEGHAIRHMSTTETTVAPLAGKDARSAQDQGMQQDKDGQSAVAAGVNDNQAASTTDDASASGSQFTDILQNLPPIAQSRMGAVSDVSPTVTGPTDVGATLQGQAIDMGVEGQWIDRMAQEITALAAGNGHSRFQLSPPNLGKIQIDVWHGENGGQVQLLTETDEAAQRLREGKHGLEADARLASLSLNSITIERASQSFDSNNDAQPQPQQQQQGSQRQQGNEQSANQGNSSLNAQTGQGDNRQGQSAAQANAQGNGAGQGQGQQNSSGQGKSSINRDVIQDRAGTMAQDGNGRRDGDRVVRYA